METNRARRQDRKLDLAARAAWLYYVAGRTQDEIAEKLQKMGYVGALYESGFRKIGRQTGKHLV